MESALLHKNNVNRQRSSNTQTYYIAGELLVRAQEFAHILTGFTTPDNVLPCLAALRNVQHALFVPRSSSRTKEPKGQRIPARTVAASKQGFGDSWELSSSVLNERTHRTKSASTYCAFRYRISDNWSAIAPSGRCYSASVRMAAIRIQRGGLDDRTWIARVSRSNRSWFSGILFSRP